MGIRQKVRTIMCRCLSVWHVIIGKIEQEHLDHLIQGRGCSPCMSEKVQLKRWKSLYEALGIRVKKLLELKQRVYDLRNDCVKDCRYIIVPNELTVEELVRIVKDKTSKLEIVVQGLGNLEGLKDDRSNTCTSYLLKMTEVDAGVLSRNSTVISDNTVLERLLYYVMIYWESNSLNKINTSVICRGTHDSRFVAEIQTKVTEGNYGKTLIWVNIDRGGRLQ